MTKKKSHPLFLLLFCLILAVYLIAILAFSTSALRFSDTWSNTHFVIGILIFPFPLFLMSRLFRKEIQNLVLLLTGMVWTGVVGCFLALGFFHFATLDEACFTEEVLRIPMNRNEVVITWRTCMGPEYGRLRVRQERRLLDGLWIRKELYERQIEAYLNGVGEWHADILVRPPHAVLVPISEGKDLSVEAFPPDRITISEGDAMKTIRLKDFVYF